MVRIDARKSQCVCSNVKWRSSAVEMRGASKPPRPRELLALGRLRRGLGGGLRLLGGGLRGGLLLLGSGLCVLAGRLRRRRLGVGLGGGGARNGRCGEDAERGERSDKAAFHYSVSWKFSS